MAGAILFVVLSWFSPEPEEDETANTRLIIVERPVLLEFVRSRTKATDAAVAASAFDGLDAGDRRAWVDRYVREEVLVREARALGLDRQDELIRRRLAQKIEFLTLGLLEEEIQIDQSELEMLYRDRGEDYRLPTTMTFTHVFADQAPGARERAEFLVESLNQSQTSFRDAIGMGDRFLYNRNYVDRTLDEIRSHFGDAFAGRLETTTPDETEWTGPFESTYGWHAILLRARTEARVPPMSEIAALLRDEGRREKREAALDRAIGALISKYRIEVELDVEEATH